MSEVQQCPLTLLGRILLHHIPLDLTGSLYHISERRYIPVIDLAEMIDEPLVVGSILYQSVFQDLSHSGGKLSRGKRLKSGQVHIYQSRHMESPYHVLELIEVHSGLAADRGIGAGKQSGRYLYEIYAAKVGGCSKSCHITHDPSSESQYQILPVQLISDQPPVYLLYGIEIFALFTRLEDNGTDIIGHTKKTRPQLIQIKSLYITVGDDAEPPALISQRDEYLRQRLKALPEAYIIPAVFMFYLYCVLQ